VNATRRVDRNFAGPNEIRRDAIAKVNVARHAR
jgi:hypothetical protein